MDNKSYSYSYNYRYNYEINKKNKYKNYFLTLLIVGYSIYFLLNIINYSNSNEENNDNDINIDIMNNINNTGDVLKNVLKLQIERNICKEILKSVNILKSDINNKNSSNLFNINNIILKELKFKDKEDSLYVSNTNKNENLNENKFLNLDIEDNININNERYKFKDKNNYNDDTNSYEKQSNIIINEDNTDIISLREDKAKIIMALNSNDETIKNANITKMFTFENAIKDAKGLYDYSKILNSTDNKVDLKKKKILIFHTHSQEGFKNTTDLKINGIVGMGEELSRILKNEYGLNVIHYTGEHDVLNGSLNREGSYERIEEAINEILKNDADIEVLIDLHRDGVPESRKLLTEIDGKKCAQIMLVNGICKLNKNNKIVDIDYLKNNYINDNFNLSMNMQIAADKLYPNMSRKILVKPYRYSLHMKPNSMLIELGAQNNTVEEIKNSLPYLAKIIYTALINKNDKL